MTTPAGVNNGQPAKRRGRPPGTKNNPNRHLNSKPAKPRTTRGRLQQQPTETAVYQGPPVPYGYAPHSQVYGMHPCMTYPYWDNYMPMSMSSSASYTYSNSQTTRNEENIFFQGGEFQELSVPRGPSVRINGLPYQHFATTSSFAGPSNQYPQGDNDSGLSSYPSYDYSLGGDGSSSWSVMYEVTVDNGLPPCFFDNHVKAVEVLNTVRGRLVNQPEKYKQLMSTIARLKEEVGEPSVGFLRYTWSLVKDILSGPNDADILISLKPIFDRNGCLEEEQDGYQSVEEIPQETAKADGKIKEMEESVIQFLTPCQTISEEASGVQAQAQSSSDEAVGSQMSTAGNGAARSYSYELKILTIRAKESVHLDPVLGKILESAKSTGKQTDELPTVIENSLIDVIHRAYKEINWKVDLCSSLEPALQISKFRRFIRGYLGLSARKRDKSVKPSSVDEAQQKGCSKQAKSTTRCSYVPAKKETEKDGFSGYTELSKEVLNNDLVLAKDLDSGNDFKSKALNPNHREGTYEDVRHEIDIRWHRNITTVRALEQIQLKIESLSESDRENFQLDTHLGRSMVFAKLSIKLLYDDNSDMISDGLRFFPLIFLPPVLQRFKIHQKQLAEFLNLCNAVIREDVSTKKRNKN